MNAVLTLTEVPSGATVAFAPTKLVIAGYTGRDEEAVRRHIDELAEIGVAPPETVPMFYDVDVSLLSTGPTCKVAGDETSGEVEPVYLRADGVWYLGVGSDHTDRRLETESILRSKAACPKPIGAEVVRLPEDLLDGGFDADFDRVVAHSVLNGETYQEGGLASLRTPGNLLPLLFGTLGEHEGDLAVFGGTLPLHGSFQYGAHWQLRLAVAGVELAHQYTTVVIDG
jgi:hypothetical protein